MADKVSRRPKKSNYQRLYRNAKREIKVYQNFAEQIIIMVPQMFNLTEKDKEKFDEYIKKMREMNNKVLSL